MSHFHYRSIHHHPAQTHTKQFKIKLSAFPFQPLVMHLVCVTLRMSMPEVLVAATLNAAAALGKADTHGSVEKGKVANLLVVDAPR